MINKKTFKKCDQITDDLYEIITKPRSVIEKLPIHLAFSVYNQAKLKMLMFVYECIEKYLPKPKYTLIVCDTDSVYLGLTTETFDDAVRPHLKKDYFKKFSKWFPSPHCDRHHDEFVKTKMAGHNWVKPTCCEKAYLYDLRSPGKFKMEFLANNNLGGVVALCSKTYYAYNAETYKISTKGIQHRGNQLDLTKDRFLEVLESQKSSGAINKGFKALNGKVYTYSQPRNGLSFLYIKRQVLPDGINTIPLDI